MRQAPFTLIQKNWQSGITLGLLSIPFSISLAVASQTTPVAGIITAVWAGLIGSLFGGSNFNIIGTTGALSGLLASYALLHGAASLASLAILAGFFILIAALLKLERFLVLVPASVIHGFTLGIAIIIALSQLNSALGISGIPIHQHLFDNIIESFYNMHLFSPYIVCIFLLFFLFLILATKIKPSIPWVIVIAPFGILTGYVAQYGYLPLVPTLGTKFGTICAQLWMFPSLTYDSSLISAGLVVALIAILETMISANIADGLTKTRHQPRKEMMGLALANIASGIAGGIPATAAIGRTIFNIKTGATHRTSGIICALTTAGISLLLLPYFTFIPLAVIAAILVFTAFRLIEAEHFIRMFQIDKLNFYLSLLVAAITIYADPIFGILVGTALSLIIFTQKLSEGFHQLAKKIIIKSTAPEKNHEEILIYAIKGELIYINSRAHSSRVAREAEQYRTIMLNLDQVNFVDLDGLDALGEIIIKLESKGKKVIIINQNPLLMPFLDKSTIVREHQRKHLFFNSYDQALEHLNPKH